MKKKQTLAQIYNEKIFPLMGEIIKVCKREDIPIFATFQLDWRAEHNDFECCTTSILQEGIARDEMIRCLNIIMGDQIINELGE